jgi:hypothetical protein
MPIDSAKKYDFGLGRMVFAQLGKEVRGNTSLNIPMSTMIQQVQAIESEWDVIDTIQPISKVHLDFTGGGNGSTPVFQFRSKSSFGQQCHITRKALQQLSQYMDMKTATGRGVKPFNLSEARCLMGEDMRKLETMAWSIQLDKIDKEVMFRSKVIDGVRTITSVQGVNYAPIRDSELLTRMLKEEDQFVSGYSIGSDYSHYSVITGEIANIKDPAKMIDIHNSDGGGRGLQALRYYWLQVCSNGMMGWSQKSAFYSRHFGDREVITNAFVEAINGIHDGDDQFLEVYQKAREIELDNLWATFLYRGDFNTEEREKGKIALDTTRLIASPQNTLGHLVDGITLMAQYKKDPMERLAIEKKATDLLFGAYSDWEKGKELVPASFLETLV